MTPQEWSVQTNVTTSDSCHIDGFIHMVISDLRNYIVPLKMLECSNDRTDRGDIQRDKTIPMYSKMIS